MCGEGAREFALQLWTWLLRRPLLRLHALKPYNEAFHVLLLCISLDIVLLGLPETCDGNLLRVRVTVK